MMMMMMCLCLFVYFRQEMKQLSSALDDEKKIRVSLQVRLIKESLDVCLWDCPDCFIAKKLMATIAILHSV